MGDRLGIHGVVDILVMLEDYHQSCRKHAKARAESSSILPLDERGISWDECLRLDTEASVSRVWHCRLADRNSILVAQAQGIVGSSWAWLRPVKRQLLGLLGVCVVLRGLSSVLQKACQGRSRELLWFLPLYEVEKLSWSLSLDTLQSVSREWHCRLADRGSILATREEGDGAAQHGWHQNQSRSDGQEDSETRHVQWTLIGPEEKLLAQGKARIHTSCRSESSN